MAVADSDPGTVVPTASADSPPRKAPGLIWLDGGVLACACPDCGAPMSVRLWLRMADCWRCGLSVELSEEQERLALELLRRHCDPESTSQQCLVRNPHVSSSPVPRSPPSPRPVRPSRPVLPQRRIIAAARPSSVRARLETIRSLGEARLWLGGLLENLPCWLASLVLHLVLILLLGMWIIPAHSPEDPLTLATAIAPREQPGGAELIELAPHPVEFDPPGVIEAERLEEDPFANPNAELAELVPDVRPPAAGQPLAPSPPALATGPAGPGGILSGRDPRLRSQLVQTEGGTNESEAAVARGLVWLARHQDSQGAWDLHHFRAAGDCAGECRNPASAPDDLAGTALALLPFLGAGQTHLQGDYREVVRHGLDWLVSRQEKNGSLQGPTFSRMYGHGLASIALCEAYAMTRDEQLRGPAQRAIDFIVRAQHADGGWRYVPQQPGDLSVVGWQLMALRSGQMAYLDVPNKVFDRAGRFLDSVQTEPSRGLYGYMPFHGASPTMTAEGLLCRQFSGWPSNHPVMMGGIDWLLSEHRPARHTSNMYYWYYGTQVTHHAGGQAWQEWNGSLRDLLVEMQESEGHEAGSWTPSGAFDPTGGRLYMTALAICTLEVYYRYMPLYKPVDEADRK